MTYARRPLAPKCRRVSCPACRAGWAVVSCYDAHEGRGATMLLKCARCGGAGKLYVETKARRR